MYSRIVRSVIIFLMVGVVFCPPPCYGDGLRTGFGKVIVEHVPIGTTYSMRRDSQFPLKVKNECDRTVTLKIEVLIPKDEEIQKGYEAIPDTKWITLEKDHFTVEPGGFAETDVLINVPNDRQYLGRKFHVFIMSYTTGQSLGIGLKSKLLFSVEGAKYE